MDVYDVAFTTKNHCHPVLIKKLSIQDSTHNAECELCIFFKEHCTKCARQTWNCINRNLPKISTKVATTFGKTVKYSNRKSKIIIASVKKYPSVVMRTVKKTIDKNSMSVFFWPDVGRPDEWAGKEDMDDDFVELQYPPNLPLSPTPVTESPSLRPAPLNRVRFDRFLDTSGRLVDEHGLRKAVFKGGVDPSARRDVWQFLFGLYPVMSTVREREVLVADYHVKYFALKKRWKEIMATDAELADVIDPKFVSCECVQLYEEQCSDWLTSPQLTSIDVQQQLSFMQIQAQVYAGRQPVDLESLRAAVRTLDKDVPRTDRECQYFEGDDNPHLIVLRDILITFAAFHPEVGYAQGMNDILARFLQVFDSEAEAYWVFNNYMENIQTDFMESGIHRKLDLLRHLMMELDPDLYAYLLHCGVADMAFCHRWLLLSFKREFSLEEGLRCFEILSSNHLELMSMEAEKARDDERRKEFEQQDGKLRTAEVEVNSEYTFDIFLCLAILMQYRDDIFRASDAAEVFQCTFSMTSKIGLDKALNKAETMFYKYCRKSVFECFQVVEMPSPSHNETTVKYTKSKHR